MTLKLLTNSRAKVARACMRKHRIRYELGYTRVEDVAELRFGSAVHVGLEAWLISHRADHKTVTPEPLAHMLDVLPDAADEYERVRLEVLLGGYHERWKAQGWEILAVEAEFTSPLINPETGHASKTWLQGGKVDAIVRTADGRVMLVEHKTSSEDISPGSEYWQRQLLDGQLSTYYDGAAALGYEIEGVIFDVLARPRQRPYKATPLESRTFTRGKPCKPCGGPREDAIIVGCTACGGTGWKEAPRLHAGQRERDETPDEFRARLVEDIADNPNAYYQRAEVVRLEAELVDHRFDIWQLGRIVAESERLGRAPKNPDACFSYRRPCPYWLVCSGQASLDDPKLYRRVENVHAELTYVERPKEEVAA